MSCGHNWTLLRGPPILSPKNSKVLCLKCGCVESLLTKNAKPKSSTSTSNDSIASNPSSNGSSEKVSGCTDSTGKAQSN